MRRSSGRSAGRSATRRSTLRLPPAACCHWRPPSPRRSMQRETPEAEALLGARRLIGAHAKTPEQERLLLAALEGSLARHRGVGPDEYRRPVRLPLAVGAAVCGEPTRAMPVAAAMLLLHAGMDTLDDLMDGD